MKVRILFLVLVLINLSCKKVLFDADPVNTPQSNFNIFWNDFNRYYPLFELNGINWDSVYAVNYSKITSNTSDADLFNIFKSCILTLKDAHSNIISNQFGYDNYANQFLSQKPANFISRDLISSKYCPIEKTNNNHLSYGKVLNQDIGYFYIGSFSDKEADYYLIDEFLEKFQNSKGIIFDVRQNGGGNESNGAIIASRLTNQSNVYRYSRFRNGPEHLDLSDFYPIILNPDGNIKYLKKVVLLTNRHTFSSAEDFTLMLRSFSNVIHIGDTTLGGVGTSPITKPLPNGWTYRISTSILYDINKKPIKNGIAPQIPVLITKEDSIQGVDRIIEKAISIINEN